MADVYSDIYSDLYGGTDQILSGSEGSVRAAIDATRRAVMGMHRSELNKLKAAISATTTSIDFLYAAGGIGRASYVAIDDELLYIWQANTSAQTADVERGMLGSFPEAHAASAIIEVNPRFPQMAIRQAIKDEIRSWFPTLFAVHSVELVSPGGRMLDLTGLGDFQNILDVRRSPRTGATIWPHMSWQLLREMGTDSFPSGSALQLDEDLDAGVLVRVVYGRNFNVTTFDDATNLQTDIGLSSSMLDIVPLGAAWRLLATREVSRTQTEAQGEPRNSQEVPPGHIVQTAAALKKQRDDRLGEEAGRLALRWAPRMS